MAKLQCESCHAPHSSLFDAVGTVFARGR
ncbi:cytochrome c3 family protein [Ferrimonas lipolytica]|uniref:Uncharacterized protein n=1 Tax=Ferrimonas lipolytica TaxID=2724191 RepID=A0A6H1UIJ1_9GAMM|nr:hypothetical protein HER31_14735 [Ferrimonas lipolytica]